MAPGKESTGSQAKSCYNLTRGAAALRPGDKETWKQDPALTEDSHSRILLEATNTLHPPSGSPGSSRLPPTREGVLVHGWQVSGLVQVAAQMVAVPIFTQEEREMSCDEWGC